MTDREKAIVMAYTGICMLEGDKLNKFYEYMNELYKRPVYTHEFLTLNIKERSEKDFMDLCRKEEPERKTGKWMRHYCEDGNPDGWKCDRCNEWYYFGDKKPNFCPNCGAKMEGE